MHQLSDSEKNSASISYKALLQRCSFKIGIVSPASMSRGTTSYCVVSGYFRGNRENEGRGFRLGKEVYTSERILRGGEQVFMHEETKNVGVVSLFCLNYRVG